MKFSKIPKAYFPQLQWPDGILGRISNHGDFFSTDLGRSRNRRNDLSSKKQRYSPAVGTLAQHDHIKKTQVKTIQF